MAKLPFNPALLLDDLGNERQATGGLRDSIWGGQVADTFDAQQRQAHFDKMRSGPRGALSAAIGGAPKPTGLFAGPGWKNFSGLMRSLMLGAQSQGKDLEVNNLGNDAANPARDTASTNPFALGYDGTPTGDKAFAPHTDPTTILDQMHEQHLLTKPRRRR